jgi:hypothetical protein
MKILYSIVGIFACLLIDTGLLLFKYVILLLLPILVPVSVLKDYKGNLTQTLEAFHKFFKL